MKVTVPPFKATPTLAESCVGSQRNLRPPLPDCPMATKIGEKGGIRFATREEAIQARKQPLDSTMGLARAIKRRVRKWRLGLKSGWSIMCKGLNWTFQEG